MLIKNPSLNKDMYVCVYVWREKAKEYLGKISYQKNIWCQTRRNGNVRYIVLRNVLQSIVKFKRG